MKLFAGDVVRHIHDHRPSPHLMTITETDGLTATVRWDGKDGAPVTETHLAEGYTLAEPIMQFFRYSHLPTHLQSRSQPFAALAHHVVSTLPRNFERTMALRKLMEAKDCAVRAALYEGP